jgi:hypothetical protein
LRWSKEQSSTWCGESFRPEMKKQSHYSPFVILWNIVL